MKDIGDQVDRWVQGNSADVSSRVEALVSGLDAESLGDVEDWARRALAETPTPLRSGSNDDLQRRRSALRWLAAEVSARRGRPEELLELLRVAWRDEGRSPAALIRRLAEYGRRDEAAAMARYVLGREECPDRGDIEALLESLGSPPDGWQSAVLAFASAPSDEGWDQLMEFTPPDALYQRTRNTVQTLIHLGVDGNVLFRCATRNGTTPDAIELVERGLVDPDTVVARGREGPQSALGFWLGLAAEAALARGDRFRTVRLLREACRVADPEFPPTIHCLSIREAADDELHAMLDAADIPR